MNARKLAPAVLALFLSVGAAAESRRSALELLPPESWPTFRDDGNPQALIDAATRSLAYYRSQPRDRTFVFGGDAFSAAHMEDSMETFLSLLNGSPEDFLNQLRERFRVYRSTGVDAKNTVVFSSYYEHTMDAALAPDDVHRYPIYRKPPDLVESDLGKGERLVTRIVKGEVKLYHTRKEIDGEKVLEGKGLEIAWAKDPMDVYFLQVQGSGWLKLPDGTPVRIRYAANNGHTYRSVGTVMIERGLIPREKFSRKAMTDWLAAHPDQRQDVLNGNPRYVFFELDRSDTSRYVYGSLRVPLTPGRSVATDPRLFPQGALAWMETEGDKSMLRFVLNQDEGGAIRGPGRVDYFAGAGEEAEKFAFSFWEKGRLYFLVKKRE